MNTKDPDANPLADKAQEVLRAVKRKDWCIATAESCTGGLLASLLTDIEGLSECFDRGFVTYAAEAKAEMLGIDPMLIERNGVVSRAVAEAMAKGAIARSKAQIAAAITGFAGPGDADDEPGLVHIAVCLRSGEMWQRECHFGDCGRDAVRWQAADTALDVLAKALA